MTIVLYRDSCLAFSDGQCQRSSSTALNTVQTCRERCELFLQRGGAGEHNEVLASPLNFSALVGVLLLREPEHSSLSSSGGTSGEQYAKSDQDMALRWVEAFLELRVELEPQASEPIWIGRYHRKEGSGGGKATICVEEVVEAKHQRSSVITSGPWRGESSAYKSAASTRLPAKMSMIGESNCRAAKK